MGQQVSIVTLILVTEALIAYKVWFSIAQRFLIYFLINLFKS